LNVDGIVVFLLFENCGYVAVAAGVVFPRGDQVAQQLGFGSKSRQTTFAGAKFASPNPGRTPEIGFRYASR
jgi:hypothetical protein